MVKRKQKKRSLLRLVMILLGVPVLALTLMLGYLIATFPKAQGKRLSRYKRLVGVQAMSYVWMIRTEKGVILIDSGIDKKAVAIKAELKKMGLKPKDVRHILLTHGHSDHISGTLAFPNAKVWIGPGETALIHRNVPVGGLFQRTMAKFSPKVLPPQKLHELRDGQSLAVDGESFRVLHTPGHTRGSVVYLWGDVLFSGDTLMWSKQGVGFLPSLLMEDTNQAFESLRKLVPFSFNFMADGHIGWTRGAQKKLLRVLQQKGNLHC